MTREAFFETLETKFEYYISAPNIKEESKMIDEILAMTFDRFKAMQDAYYQYQFFCDGYRHGSASISEVTHAHDEFLKLLSQS